MGGFGEGWQADLKMQWWCAATGREWTWTWRPYPGVWLAILALGLAYVWWLKRVPGRIPPARRVAFGTGLAVLWIALDWPIGALGAGYLLGIHTLQYVLITLITAPLLLLGIPPAAWSRVESARAGPVLARLARPAVGLLGYIAVLGITHTPRISDTLMASQLGSFLVDALWLLGGLGLWWPVVAPSPYQRMAAPVRVGYLFLATIPPTVPSAFLLFADYPLYAVYELAPKVGGVEAVSDQQTAGVLMKAAMDPILWIAMGIVFFRWYRLEQKAERLAEELDT